MFALSLAGWFGQSYLSVADPKNPVLERWLGIATLIFLAVGLFLGAVATRPYQVTFWSWSRRVRFQSPVTFSQENKKRVSASLRSANTLERLSVLYNLAAGPAYASADRILDHLCDLLIVPYQPGVEHRPTAAHHLALLVNNCVRDEGRRTSALFTNAMQRLPDSGFNDDKQVQELFADYYQRYLNLRYWIHTLAGLADTSLSAIPNYRSWRAQERAFFDRFRELIAHDDFTVLRQRVGQVVWDEFLSEEDVVAVTVPPLTDDFARAKIRNDLGNFLLQLDRFFDQQVRSDQELQEWVSELNRVINATIQYITQHVGPPEAAIFRSVSGAVMVSWGHSYNAEHTRLLTSLNRYRENLRSLKENL